MRPPARQSSLTEESPKRTAVPGAPSTPASDCGVPGGLVVTRAGRWSPFTVQARASASIQNDPIAGAAAGALVTSGRSAAQAGAQASSVATATALAATDESNALTCPMTLPRQSVEHARSALGKT